MILVAKTQNIYKAQKWSQKASRSLLSRVMSNLHFSQNWQKIANLRAISPRERCSDKFSRKKASQPLRNLVIFSKKWYQKTTISDSKTWKILKVQKWHQKTSRSLKSRVMSKFWIWEFGNLRAIFPWYIGSLLMEKRNYWWKRGLSPPET